MAVHKAPRTSGNNRYLLFVVPPALIIAALALLVFFGDDMPEPDSLDEDLCPVVASEIDARATYLIDLRKPLAQPRLPGNLLRDVSMDIAANTELSVFALTENAGAPRQLLGKLCKPYANADLAVAAAKDMKQGVRDCSDMPAQLPPGVRSGAERFCARRDAIARRIDELASAAEAPLPNAYLMEALEETNLAFAETPGAEALYVFSDMMQHAPWYSQPELGWQGWNLAEFTARRERLNALVGPHQASPNDLRLTVFYVPVAGMTDTPRAKHIHKEFWRGYFGAAAPNFQDQSTAPTYAIAPVMEMPLEQPEADAAPHASPSVETATSEQGAPAPAETEGDVGLASEEAAPPLGAASEQAAQETPAPTAADSAPGADDAVADCPMQLKDRFANIDPYPAQRQVDYGTAVIAVRFEVNEQGAVEDDLVQVLHDLSTAEDQRNYPLFAQAAFSLTQGWEFDFDETGDRECNRRQQRTTQITFDYAL